MKTIQDLQTYAQENNILISQDILEDLKFVLDKEPENVIIEIAIDNNGVVSISSDSTQMWFLGNGMAKITSVVKIR